MGDREVKCTTRAEGRIVPTTSFVHEPDTLPQVHPISEDDLVSVIIPSYNHRRFITEAIGSVYKQTYRPIELIIIDDGSSDGSPDAIREFLGRAPPPKGITISFNARENRGAHASINEGIMLARGRYIALLNSDDAYVPERIARCVAVARACDSQLIFTYVEPIDAEGRTLDHEHPWRRWYYEAQKQELAIAPTVGFILLTYNIAVSTGNFVFRRGLVDEIGSFQNYKYAHDLDFLMRALEVEEPVLIREPLYRYRLHDANTISAPYDRVDGELEQIFRRYLRSVLTAPPANPLAPTFDNWPSCLSTSFGQLTRGLNKAIDSLLETRSVPAAGATTKVTDLPRLPQITQSHRTRVTVISHELSRTGAPVLALGVADAMVQAGAKVNVVSMTDGPLRLEFERAGMPVIVALGTFYRRLAKLSHRLDALSSRYHAMPYVRRSLGWLSRATTIVGVGASALKVAMSVRGYLLINSFAAWPVALPVLALRPRIQARWYIHESYDPHLLLRGRTARRLFKKACQRKNVTFLFGSEGARRVWRLAGCDGEVRYWSGLPAAIPPRTAQRARTALEKSPQPRRIVLSVGTSGTRKGTRILIEAFAHGRRAGVIPDDVDLVIVGCPPPSSHAETRDYIVRVHRPDLRDRVRLVGIVESAALDSYYDEADVYVQSSTMESLPLALLTAMAHGLPIVTTDVDGCKEAILDGICGLTIPPRDIPQLASAIGQMFANPERARAWGEAARERFVQVFSLDATADPLVRTILSAGAGRSAVAPVRVPQ